MKRNPYEKASTNSRHEAEMQVITLLYELTEQMELSFAELINVLSSILAKLSREVLRDEWNEKWRADLMRGINDSG